MIERNAVASIPQATWFYNMSAWKSTLSTIIYKMSILLYAKKIFCDL